MEDNNANTPDAEDFTPAALPKDLPDDPDALKALIAQQSADLAKAQSIAVTRRDERRSVEKQLREEKFGRLKVSHPWLEPSDLEGVGFDKWEERVGRLATIAGLNGNPAGNPNQPGQAAQPNTAQGGNVNQPAVTTLPPNQAVIDAAQQFTQGIGGTPQPQQVAQKRSEWDRRLKAGEITMAQYQQAFSQGLVTFDNEGSVRATGNLYGG